MRKLCAILALGSSVAMAGCDTSNPTAPDAVEPLDVALSSGGGATPRATGGGFLDFGGGTLVQFSFNAIQEKDAGLDATGHFNFSVTVPSGVIDFKSTTTCMAVDPVEGRAWIGGVVLENNSTHPSFTTDIHEPGDDVWFRVLDSGEGSGAAPDRSTFVGFEGGGGIPTSEAYCDAQIWPHGNARTVPQASGNIQVSG